MPIVYADIDDAAALRSRLEALSVAKIAMVQSNARLPLGVSMGPPGASQIPSDTQDLTIASATDHPEWPLLVGFPPSLRAALRQCLEDWLIAEMAATTAALVELGADVTGAPA